MLSDREKKLEAIISHFLSPPRGIPFELVLRSLYGVSVQPFDRSGAVGNALLNDLEMAFDRVCHETCGNPMRRARPNEVGNDIEPVVLEQLCKAGLNASRPRTRTSRGKSTGYPDIVIEMAELPVYLEVKTYAAANHATTQRSFYVSPSDDPKVTRDGYHLLVGFEVERDGNDYVAVAFELVDLYGMDCDMKSEFNSDNRRMYDPKRRLLSGRVR